jgi:nucleoid DNA-binding protein
MSLGKSDIVKNINTKALFSSKLSHTFLSAFLLNIKKNLNYDIKISNFGVFSINNTPARVGRNPKTKEEYIIPTRKRLSFKASNKIKSILN